MLGCHLQNSAISSPNLTLCGRLWVWSLASAWPCICIGNMVASRPCCLERLRHGKGSGRRFRCSTCSYQSTLVCKYSTFPEFFDVSAPVTNIPLTNDGNIDTLDLSNENVSQLRLMANFPTQCKIRQQSQRTISLRCCTATF